MLQTLLGGVGAGLALPSIVEAQHPVQHHLASATGVEQAQKKAAAAAYKPEFLDAHQLKTLDVLAEAIVPGSTRRQGRAVPRSAAGRRVGAEPARRSSARSARSTWPPSRSTARPGRLLTAAEQDALLQDASPDSGRASGKSTMRDHFQNLKGWIAGAYYSSEAGMSELGWTGNVFHQELPGCTHPGGHSA